MSEERDEVERQRSVVRRYADALRGVADEVERANATISSLSNQKIAFEKRLSGEKRAHAETKVRARTVSPST